MIPLFFLLLLSAATAHISAGPGVDLKICGYYCGPGWCANTSIGETQCVTQNIWGMPAEPDNCVDACCRDHDKCCGGNNRPVCNREILSCIQKNSCYNTICGAAVWAAMKVAENWCCGSECPVFGDISPEQLSSTNFCYDDIKIAFLGETFTIIPFGKRLLANPGFDNDCPNVRYLLNTTSNDVILGYIQTKVFSQHQNRLTLTAGSPKGARQCFEKQLQGHALSEAESIVFWPHTRELSVMTLSGRHIIMSACK